MADINHDIDGFRHFSVAKRAYWPEWTKLTPEERFVWQQKAKVEFQEQQKERDLRYQKELKIVLVYLKYLRDCERKAPEAPYRYLCFIDTEEGCRSLWETLMYNHMIAFCSVNSEHLFLARYFYRSLWEKEVFLLGLAYNWDDEYAEEHVNNPEFYFGGVQALVNKLSEINDERGRWCVQTKHQGHPWRKENLAVRCDFEALYDWAEYDLKELNKKYPVKM